VLAVVPLTESRGITPGQDARRSSPAHRTEGERHVRVPGASSSLASGVSASPYDGGSAASRSTARASGSGTRLECERPLLRWMPSHNAPVVAGGVDADDRGCRCARTFWVLLLPGAVTTPLSKRSYGYNGAGHTSHPTATPLMARQLWRACWRLWHLVALFFKAPPPHRCRRSNARLGLCHLTLLR
jgi:hypothetical protein